MIPQNYKEWHYCIVNECGIELTEEYIQQRLEVLNNSSHQETRRMLSLYGKAHLEKVISWFMVAAHEKNSEMNEIGKGQIH